MSLVTRGITTGYSMKSEYLRTIEETFQNSRYSFASSLRCKVIVVPGSCRAPASSVYLPVPSLDHFTLGASEPDFFVSSSTSSAAMNAE